MLRTLRILAFCGLAACGDATGLGQIPNMEGDWTYVSFWSSSGILWCTYDGTLTIDQTGATFTGSVVISDLRCAFGAALTPVSLGQDLSYTIVNGTIDAAGDVTFDLGDEDRHHTGEVSGDSMSGDLRLTDDLLETGNAVTYTGAWVARR